MKLLDLGFRLMAVVGLGMMQFAGIGTPISDGGAQYQRSVPLERTFSLIGTVMEDGLNNLQRVRASLEAILTPQRTATDQPLVLRYHRVDPNTGDETECLDIPCVFDGAGLAGALDNEYQEKIELTFKQFLPAIYQDGQQGAEIGYWSIIDNASRIIQRSESGVWSALGSGMNETVYCINYGQDGNLYAGGNFTTAGGGAANYIAKWDGSTWSALGAGMNGIVRAIAFDQEGNLYAGGEFTTAGGGAANYIAKWDGSTWSALGAGMNNLVYALAVDMDGNLFAGGQFTTAGGGAASRVAKWDGSAWSALGTGMDGAILALKMGPDGYLYAGGNFTTADGSTALYVAKWDGSAWSAVGNYGTSAAVRSLAFDLAGNLIIGGDFLTVDGLSAIHIAQWNGVAWSALGEGVGGIVYSVVAALDGSLHIGGQFSEAGGVPLYDGLVRYKNGAYTPLPVNIINSTEGVPRIAINPSTGIMVYAGSWTSSIAFAANDISLVNSGTAKSYPVLDFKGPGTLYTIQNGQQEITFDDLVLVSGEEAILNTNPLNASFKSSTRGDLSSYILPQSTELSLQPGDNLTMLLFAPNPVETGDNNNQLSNYNLAGIVGTNTDAGKLYVTITYSAPNYRIRIYKDAARTLEVANSANYTTTGIKTISEANSSGISGYITVDATTAADNDIVVTFPLAMVHWTPQYLGIDGATH